MTAIIFVGHDGTRHVVEVEDGLSVMEAALQNAVAGINGDCGGSCSCGTCHVYIEADWRSVTGQASDEERDMLDYIASSNETSRLACQIRVNPALQGLTVKMPEQQG